MEKDRIEEILKKQRDYFKTGATFDLSFRRAALKKLNDAMAGYGGRLSEALKKDLGKCDTEAYMCETGLGRTEISHMIKNLGRYASEKRVRTPLAQYVSRSFIKPVPYGSVLIMSPWNYPVLLSIDPLADAIAAGNTVVLKPSAYAPNVSEVLREMLTEIFPEKYVAVITGGREENSALLDMDFDMIFFTGSKTVGREVLRKAAEHLTPAVLELGGKSPCIVDETADIALASRRIVFGKLLNCGQTCVAPDYIYCAESIKDELIAGLKKEMIRQYGDDPLRNEDYGKIINRKHFDRIAGLIKAAKERRYKEGEEDGADAASRCRVWGGETDAEGLKIAPAIIEDADMKDAAMNEEIFGPVLPVLTYKNLRDAAEEINKRDHPLALYIFSHNKENIRYVKERVQFGGGCINDTIIHLATPYMGFGGVGGSGMGAYHGKAGFDAFSHRKSMVDKKIFLDLPMRYQPYKRTYDRLIRLFLR